jgi:site-specific DNA recombinase
LEGFAHGRFGSQSEVQRFFESQSCFPRGRDGKVHLQRVKDILERALYAGHIHLPDWDIRYLRGKHEPLVSFETWKAIQDRLKAPAKVKLSTRSDIGQDFALRGMVNCHGCNSPYYSGWSKGRKQSYAYYFCRNKECTYCGKNLPKRCLGIFERCARRV